MPDRARDLSKVIAAHISWANTADPTARTAPARRAFMARFELLADPDGVLPESERLRRAKHLADAHFADMSQRSAAARRRRPSPPQSSTDG